MSAKGLPKYDPSEACAKCRTSINDTRFPAIVAWVLPTGQPDYMDVTCARCGHDWKRYPADYTEELNL